MHVVPTIYSIRAPPCNDLQLYYKMILFCLEYLPNLYHLNVGRMFANRIHLKHGRKNYMYMHLKLNVFFWGLKWESNACNK